MIQCFEACWIIINITTGTTQHVEALIKLGIVPRLVTLMKKTQNDDVTEKIVWILSNIAGDSPAMRKNVMFVLPDILDIVTRGHMTLSMTRVAVACIANMCNGRPRVSLSVAHATLSVLSLLLTAYTRDAVRDAPSMLDTAAVATAAASTTDASTQMVVRPIATDDEIIIHDICWALASLLKDDETDQCMYIDAALSYPSILPALIFLLRTHASPTLHIPVLQCISHICFSSVDAHVQQVIDAGFLGIGKPFVNPATATAQIRKETCLILSNIAAGNEHHIEALLNANIIPDIVDIAEHDSFNVAVEALYVMTKIIDWNGSDAHIQYLVNQNAVHVICTFLACPDAGVVLTALKSIRRLLIFGTYSSPSHQSHTESLHAQHVNPIRMLIESCDGFAKIEQLQEHDNESIYMEASGILTTYADISDDHESSDVGMIPHSLPSVATADMMD
jgi:hypothetical protein